jgi:3',5'-cyclic AMP phosphodiesterase CpdA
MSLDRRGFLKCMAWAGTGVLWTVSGGVLSSCTLAPGLATPKGSFSFVQLSDSHIGFNKAPNADVVKTLQVAIDQVNALDATPELMIHTGDLTHLSKAAEFDTVAELLKGLKTKEHFYVPGEHDNVDDHGKQYLERFGRGARGAGWHSFDQRGVHFIGLSNVFDLPEGGLGRLGAEQLAWIEKDVAGLSASTPIVVFAHIPLWSVYPQWGWGTDDAGQALGYLKRFGSVTVLNGHIHQVMQKVEGNVTFHTARSTAFPQPEPGKAAGPGPMNVPAERLKSLLGISAVEYREKPGQLAIVDSSLGA